MGSPRSYTTRVLLSFVAGLALVPGFVWAIQAVHEAQREPTTADVPGIATPATPVAPAPAEPPAASREPEPEPRPEPRRARMVASVTAQADGCAAGCSLGTIEAVTGGGELETTDEPQKAARIIDTLLRTPELPTEGLDEVEERLDDVEERLGRIVPIEDVPALVPEPVEAPTVVIELNPVETTPLPAPDVALPVDPPVELPDPGESDDEEPAASDPSEPTALLVLDGQTADELGLRKRMTLPLGDALQAALAILGERRALGLSIAAPDSSGQSRD